MDLLAASTGPLWNPSESPNSLLQHINSRSVSALRLLTFFKQIPEFNDLNVQDKVTLIKYNLMPLVIINGTLSYREDIDQVLETETDVPWNSSFMQEVHGEEIYQQVRKVFESFLRIAQYDRKIILLALIVLILTKGFTGDSDTTQPILNDELAVYRAQSYYTELLWKYMETVHGAEKATLTYQQLIFSFISWQTLDGKIRRNIRQVLSPTDMDDMLPLMKSLSTWRSNILIFVSDRDQLSNKACVIDVCSSINHSTYLCMR
jgi:hypothetical protein